MANTFTFPDITKRDHFLRLCDIREGQFGIGCGLEFEGLRYALGSDNGSGRLRCVRSKSCGDWKVRGTTLEIDWGFIRDRRESFDSLLRQINETAENFGAGTTSGVGGYGGGVTFKY